MKREVAVSIVIIALLVVAGLILYANQSDLLSQIQATATAQSNTLDARAREGTQVALAATEAADTSAQAATADAGTQAALQDELATRQASAEEVATEAAATRAAFEQQVAAAAETQTALEDDLATNRAAAESTGTQAASIENDLATSQADATALYTTATRLAVERDEAATEAAAAVESLLADIADLQANATQFVSTSANQSAMVEAAVTAQAQSVSTIAALENDLATALAQPGALVPTESAAAPTPTSAVIAQAAPVAAVEVGNLIYDETFDQDSTWFVGERAGAGTAALVDGQYIITVDVVPSSMTVFSPQMVADGYAEVEVDLSDCPPESLFGLFMRVQERAIGGYFFAFPCNMSFWAIVAFQEGVQPQVLNSADLSGVAATPEHTIGVLMNGASLTLYLDGVQLGSAADSTFQNGALGIYGETLSAELSLRFDNFRMWELP